MARSKKNKEEEEDLRSRLTTFKYSANGICDLHESVIIDGKPQFIWFNHEKNKPEILHELGEEFRILVPAVPTDYSYIPYSFKDDTDILNTFQAAQKENLDMLFEKALSIVSKYNDQDSYKLESIASDAIWSYFQDRFATTRYELLTGGV